MTTKGNGTEGRKIRNPVQQYKSNSVQPQFSPFGQTLMISTQSLGINVNINVNLRFGSLIVSVIVVVVVVVIVIVIVIVVVV